MKYGDKAAILGYFNLGSTFIELYRSSYSDFAVILFTEDELTFCSRRDNLREAEVVFAEYVRIALEDLIPV